VKVGDRPGFLAVDQAADLEPVARRVEIGRVFDAIVGVVREGRVMALSG
jgi:hypothetical protein